MLANGRFLRNDDRGKMMSPKEKKKAEVIFEDKVLDGR